MHRRSYPHLHMNKDVCRTGVIVHVIVFIIVKSSAISQYRIKGRFKAMDTAPACLETRERDGIDTVGRPLCDRSCRLA